MADAKPSIEKAEKGTEKYSPLAGCSIFIIAGVLAILMIAFAFWVGSKMQERVRSFTEEDSRDIESVETAGKETQQVALKNKLVGFRHSIEAKHKAEMSLNADEINLAIATFEILKPQRGNLRVTKIQEDSMIAEISYPVKDGIGSIFSGKVRYLNGTLTIQPEVVDGAVFPKITRITPSVGGDIPSDLLQEISKILLYPLKNDKELGILYSQISAVELKDNALVLHTSPDYQPAELPNEAKKQSMFERFMTGFAVIAVIFLAIVGVIIILSRRKTKQSS